MRAQRLDRSGERAGTRARSPEDRFQAERDGVTPAPARKAPIGYFVAEEDGGEVRLIQGQAARQEQYRGSELAVVLWNGAVAAALGAGLALSRPPRAFSDPVYFAGLCPYMLMGAFAARAVLWRRYGYEEWRASPGCLERRRRWAFSPAPQTRRFARGHFKVHQSGRSSSIWQLSFEATPISPSRLLCSADSDGPAPAELLHVAQLLADSTGWPLDVRM